MNITLDDSGPKWVGLRPVRVHSVVLAVAGIVYIAVGITYLTGEVTQSRLEALVYALQIIEYRQWGWVWIFVGLLSIVSSRWPPISETWGYFVLTGQAAAWALFYASGVIFAGTPTGNFSGVLSWGLIGFMWIMISKLVNPEVMKILLKYIQDLQAENLALHDELRRIREGRG